MRKTALFFALSLLCQNPALAGTIVSTFDGSDEGWLVPPADGTIAWNPAGYLEIEDIRTGFLTASAPSSFTGDLSSFDGGTLSFESALVVAYSTMSLDRFGEVTIAGNGLSATLDIVPSPLPAPWTTYSAPLSASAWGLSQANWETMLSGVTSISLVVDSYNELGDIITFDNFRVESPAPVPLPAALWLFGPAVAGMGWFARQSRRSR